MKSRSLGFNAGTIFLLETYQQCRTESGLAPLTTCAIIQAGDGTKVSAFKTIAVKQFVTQYIEAKHDLPSNIGAKHIEQ